MVKSCVRLAAGGPFIPCSCAHNCDCACHGKKEKSPKKSLPFEPDSFNTTNRGYHVPMDPNSLLTGKPWKQEPNLGLQPGVAPLDTEV